MRFHRVLLFAVLSVVASGCFNNSTKQLYLYASNRGSNTISQFKVGPNGVLTPLSVPTTSVQSVPGGMATSPEGRTIYATSETLDSVSVGRFVALGELEFSSSAGTGDQPVAVATNQQERALYVANFAEDTVMQFDIQPDGFPAATITPDRVATGDGPVWVTVHPTGDFVYVSNFGSDTISQYSVNGDGSLTALSPATVPAGDGPWGITLSAAGTRAYVASSLGDAVLQYSVGADGKLTALAPASVPSGDDVASVVLSRDGRFLYAAARANTQIYQYEVLAGGTLTPLTPAFITGAGSGPFPMIMSPDLDIVYVANQGSNTVSSYTIGATGQLTFQSSAATGTMPSGLTFTRR